MEYKAHLPPMGHGILIPVPTSNNRQQEMAWTLKQIAAYNVAKCITESCLSLVWKMVWWVPLRNGKNLRTKNQKLQVKNYRMCMGSEYGNWMFALNSFLYSTKQERNKLRAFFSSPIFHKFSFWVWELFFFTRSPLQKKFPNIIWEFCKPTRAVKLRERKPSSWLF